MTEASGRTEVKEAERRWEVAAVLGGGRLEGATAGEGNRKGRQTRRKTT
jgi:hypothetical protein